MKIEYNSTEGDAGLQVFLDAPAWREVSITNPYGQKMRDVRADRVIRNYGLTELFSESSDPLFDEFPFSEFKRLFPEDVYTFRGQTIEGERLASSFVLTHKVPDGPTIVSPTADAALAPDHVAVEWIPVTSPAGVDVVAYQVLVVADAPALGNPKRVFDVRPSLIKTDCATRSSASTRAHSRTFRLRPVGSVLRIDPVQSIAPAN